MANTLLEKKLGDIESELYNLKSIIIKLIQQPEQRRVIKLKGVLKGIKVSEEEIKEAKSALFKGS